MSLGMSLDRFSRWLQTEKPRVAPLNPSLVVHRFKSPIDFSRALHGPAQVDTEFGRTVLAQQRKRPNEAETSWVGALKIGWILLLHLGFLGGLL